MPLELHLREMRAADVERVLTIEATAGHERWSEQMLTDLLDHPRSSCLVGMATVNGEPLVLAHIIALIVVDEAEIITIAVHPQHWRQGYGRTLLGGALARWEGDGVSRVVLEVRDHNRAAIALYEAFDFETQGRRARYYADGSDARILVRSTC